MKRLKPPEEDIENPGKGCHHGKKTEARNRAEASEEGKDLTPVDTPLQPAFFAGLSSGASE